MRILSVIAIVSSFAALTIGPQTTQASDFMYGTACYYVPVYYDPCMPNLYAPRVHHSRYGYDTAPRNYRPSQTYDQSAAPRSAPTRPTTTSTIAAYDNYFEPKTVRVQPGTTVRWVNRGSHNHTVTARDDSWDSGDIPPGGTYSATFQNPGTYSYYCRHHMQDKMQGTIIVESAVAGQPGAGSFGAGSSGY